MKRKVVQKAAVNPLMVKQAAEIKALKSAMKFAAQEAQDNAITLGVFIGLTQSICDYRITSTEEALSVMRQLTSEAKMQEAGPGTSQPPMEPPPLETHDAPTA